MSNRLNQSANARGDNYYSSSSSSSFYSSSSYSSSSQTGNEQPQTTGRAYSTHTYTNPSGTTVKTSSQNLGEAPVSETRRYDSQGHEMIGSGSGADSSRRIQDVTDEEANRQYDEAMEDEYTKREGGA